MDIQQAVAKASESMNAGVVFGQPIQQGDAVVIPAARVRGGGGGGTGPEQAGGSGSGFGMSARPAGAFVVRGGEVTWRPAINVNAVILGAQVVMATALFLVASILRQRQHHLAHRRGLHRGHRER